MLCSPDCPKGLTGCRPLSNIVSTLEDGSPDPDASICCVGLHDTVKAEDLQRDRFRHCFRSKGDTDTMYDYDEYDLESTMSVFSEALLIDRYIVE